MIRHGKPTVDVVSLRRDFRERTRRDTGTRVKSSYHYVTLRYSTAGCSPIEFEACVHEHLYSQMLAAGVPIDTRTHFERHVERRTSLAAASATTGAMPRLVEAVERLEAVTERLQRVQMSMHLGRE